MIVVAPGDCGMYPDSLERTWPVQVLCWVTCNVTNISMTNVRAANTSGKRSLLHRIGIMREKIN